MLQQQGLKYLQTNLCVLQTGMKHGGGKECFVIKNCAHVFLILRTQRKWWLLITMHEEMFIRKNFNIDKKNQNRSIIKGSLRRRRCYYYHHHHRRGKGTLAFWLCFVLHYHARCERLLKYKKKKKSFGI